MAIKKIITVDGIEVPFKASATLPRLYRAKFRKDIFKDFSALKDSVDESDEENSGLGIETALGMSADDSAHFADILAAASSNANTNVSLMGESFKYVAPIAGSMGASAEDLSIALGLMANSGIKGSQAGNSLKNALVNLTKPTKQQAAAMQQLGFISTETIQKIDFAKVEKAEQAVEDATISLDNAQIKLNDAISKYGEGSSQAQLASNNYEKAQLKLARAQETLAKEQEGVSKEIAGANTLMGIPYPPAIKKAIEVLQKRAQHIDDDIQEMIDKMEDDKK